MATETVTNQPVQTEVTLRTLSSDIQSVEHGGAAPTPTTVKLTSQFAEEKSQDEKQSGPPRKIGKTIMLIIVLIAIATVGYLYLYPKLIEALTPPAVVH